MYTKGIDTSHHQASKVDYVAAKAAGYKFVILRIGCGKTKDKCFENDYAAAIAAGLKVGVYYYTYSTTEVEAVHDATRVLGWLNGRKLDLPAVYDLEDAKQKGTHRREVNTDMYEAFADRIKEAGYECMLYTGEYFYNSYFEPNVIKDPLWIAKYSSNKPDVGQDICIWQYTSNAITSDFYKEKLDRNVLLIDKWNIDTEVIIMGNPYVEPTRLLKRTYPIMMKGTDVKWLQYQLNLRGYKLTVDGKFGNSTNDAVKDFQDRNGLKVDGKVGPATRYALLNGKDINTIKTYSKKASGETKISANFKVKEFACKDGSDTVKIDTVTVGYLQKARDKFEVPIHVNSGYRTSAYNKKVGGSTNSYHVKGQAVDHHTNGKVDLMKLAKFYESIGCLGIIVYPNSGFVHIDSRTKKYFAIDDGKTIVKKTTFSK